MYKLLAHVYTVCYTSDDAATDDATGDADVAYYVSYVS